MMFIEFIVPTLLCILAFHITLMDVNAIHAVVAFLVTCGLFCHYQTQVVISATVTAIFGLQMIAKMIYQMDWVTEKSGDVHCVSKMACGIGFELFEGVTEHCFYCFAEPG